MLSLSPALLKMLNEEPKPVKVKTGTYFRIVGDTYPVKEILKLAGCRWNPDGRYWYATKELWHTAALGFAERAKDKERIERLVSVPVQASDPQTYFTFDA